VPKTALEDLGATSGQRHVSASVVGACGLEAADKEGLGKRIPAVLRPR
jgi:hypothetical protein